MVSKNEIASYLCAVGPVGAAACCGKIRLWSYRTRANDLIHSGRYTGKESVRVPGLWSTVLKPHRTTPESGQKKIILFRSLRKESLLLLRLAEWPDFNDDNRKPSNVGSDLMFAQDLSTLWPPQICFERIKSVMECFGLKLGYGVHGWKQQRISICANLAPNRRAWAAARLPRSRHILVKDMTDKAGLRKRTIIHHVLIVR